MSGLHSNLELFEKIKIKYIVSNDTKALHIIGNVKCVYMGMEQQCLVQILKQVFFLSLFCILFRNGGRIPLFLTCPRPHYPSSALQPPLNIKPFIFLLGQDAPINTTMAFSSPYPRDFPHIQPLLTPAHYPRGAHY